MKHFYWSLLALLALLACLPAHAGDNLVTNPYLPYPPGCMEAALAGDVNGAVTFFDKELIVPEFTSDLPDEVPLRVRAWRSPCAEPGRSLIWLEFSMPAASDSQHANLQLFSPITDLGSDIRKDTTLAADPGGWGSGHHAGQEITLLSSEPRTIDGGSPDNGERKWTFLLENDPFNGRFIRNTYEGLTPEEYNSGFRLLLHPLPELGWIIDVPATADLFPQAAPGLPLSGRLSGIWAVEGALGQGFQFAISEQVISSDDGAPGHPDVPLVFFFTHYTFDADNRPVWLAGSTEFEPGARSVTLPVMRLANGTFRGDSPADREVIGEVTISANGCDDLGFEYDYAGLGLGAGQARLQRVHSLETAGHDCRDYPARVAANR